MFVNHAAFEEGTRHQRVTSYTLMPRQASEQADYQVLVENIPSLFEEDLRMIQNKEEIPFWVEEKGKAWAKLAKLKVKTPQLLFAMSGNSSDKSKSDGDTTFEFFDEEWKTLAQLQTATTSYDAFGILIKTGDDTILHLYRVATSHLTSRGKLVKRTYTISTSTWSAASDVFEDATYDCRDACGGIIGSNIFLFFTRYNHTNDTYVDLGYIKSTDLSGSSWGSRVTLTTTANYRFNHHGHLVHVSGNIYMQPWYEHNGSGNWKVKIYKTSDAGANWSVVSVYDGATFWGESSMDNIGNNKMVMLLRDNNGGYVGQTVSSDSGETWSAPVNTNLGISSGIKALYTLYDPETKNLIAIYHDRGDNASKISETDADTVYSSATSWNTVEEVDSGFAYNGYHSIVKIASGKYFFVYSKQVTSSDADIWGGEYPLKWEIAGTPTTTNGVLSLSDDSAILGKTGVGYNHAIVARAKADEQDIRFVMLADTIALNCQNRLGITNSDFSAPDDFEQFDFFACKDGSSAPADFGDAIDFRNVYLHYEIRRISGRADYYQGDTLLGSITNAAFLPTIDLKAKAIVWDNSQESTLDIDWIFIRKYTSPDCLVLKKRTSGKADVIKAIVSGLVA